MDADRVTGIDYMGGQPRRCAGSLPKPLTATSPGGGSVSATYPVVGVHQGRENWA